VPLLGEGCVVSGRELASAPPTGVTAASEALGLASGGGAHTDPAWQERKLVMRSTVDSHPHDDTV
jgi:hypothetical protein